MSDPSRELTLRALLTGLLLGAVLTPSNIYSGLKIGWSFNMSIIALLVGFAFWQSLARVLRRPAWTLHESNINQTTASSAASIISSGLVAPIPAYTLITGQQFDTLPLVAWVFSVSFLGIWVAWYLRPSLIIETQLRFPEGMATLATMQQIYSHGAEAARRLWVLGSAALLAALAKLVDGLWWSVPRWAPSAQLERLTFSLEPSLLLLGFGGIIGLRVGLSLLLGALIAWGVLAPWLLTEGLVTIPAGASGPQFGVLIEWLLWPGVSLMVCATLISLSLRFLRARRGAAAQRMRFARPAPLPALGLGLAAILVIALQMSLFDIHPLMAALSIPLALVLAMVAARVVGATGIPPIGAIGQLSQLSFAAIAPGQVAINLMSANTAGGAAGQCTDLLNDFKVGHAIGATPSRQVVAQCLGILVGSLVGVLVYQLLIPDPQAMLITPEWPAPAVATWKAVAQALTAGLGSISLDIRWAMLIGALVGVVLGLLEGSAPVWRLRWLPSSAALGLAFIIPASISLMMAFGAVLAWLFVARWGSLAERCVIVAAAGLVAGESMAGIGISLWQLLR
ncbi:peptide transporter [Pseudomonas sp. Choline-3u-10]|jgi:putative OPT family oligopeptide transporter|uniref:OPT family oligopeptide transporter n=1 Tax=Pseudomonadaceae TaxID=135621 RepID=UPI000617A93C|nr:MULTISPECIES: OPT family oligopeptide transporter [Pseudomonadaceae]MAL36932.1 peptide transporter [Pseudomonas sp.]MBU0951008.1 OPT/YSL family transporter [Gammaproteobacteria bacterium]KJJ63028.1 peptide transporter [Pseudomonas sp. 10B238]MBK3797210.1 OPT family oligopeptide transporter [Stutzerimonas stutzeri]MBK3876050.1 OPT family oligopeptide transporter [Stutzerimonas stutzeri]|tara:strand:- start:55 stop:1755 length:1701 start_codon:yes stop_codon:yes gene_type:complete